MYKEYRVLSAATFKTIAIYGINASLNKILKDMEKNGWELCDRKNYNIEPIQARYGEEAIYIYMA